MSKISRFTSKTVQLAKNAIGDRVFAGYAVVSLHCLRGYLERSYRETLDLLSEMPHILGEIGLELADLPHHSTLVKWFDRIKTALWRVLLRLSAQLHDLSGHVAIDAMFFDRENASKHCCRQTNYRVQTLKTTGLVDTESQAILDVHCTIEKRHDTQLGWRVASLAADKGYDWMELHEKLREEDVRPRYHQRAMCETVFSTIKRTLGDAVCARSWYGEFRELVLMCTVYNIKQAVIQ